MNVDVLVVGAGPTGLTLANLLGRMGVSTLLIERNLSTVDEPRAVSIDDESMRTMQAAGLSDEILAITARGYGSIYRGPNGRPFAKVMPHSREYGFDKRNAFQQPELEAILRDALSRFDHVETRFGAELRGIAQDEHGVTAEVQTGDGRRQSVRAQYLVGCDGARSFVRRELGLKLEGGTFEEPWLIVDLARTENRCRHTEVFCNPERSCISLPGPGGIRRYEFLLRKGETREQAEAEPFARDLLRSFGPDGDAPLRRVRVYTFHARLADAWRRGRVFLAGDAAHLTPPFAGQGMNSGLRDASNLSWKLAEAVASRPDEAFLDSYEIERKPHAKAMIDLALQMGRVMMPQSAMHGLLVRTGFRLLGLYPPARDYVAQMKYKPKPRFRAGLVSFGDGGTDGSLVGRLLPQPVVETPSRERVLLDDRLPQGPVLLVFDAQPEAALPIGMVEAAEAAGAKVVGLTPEGVNPGLADFPIYRDVSSFFSDEKAGVLGSVVLLRRDRYVAAMRAIPAAAELLRLIPMICPSAGRMPNERQEDGAERMVGLGAR